MYRSMFKLSAVFLALVLVATAIADTVRDVTIVSAGSGKVTLLTPSGSEHTIDVSKDARITCDGKTCRLEDLKKDYKADVTGERQNNQKTITTIDARSK
jgi:hypothetical protein